MENNIQCDVKITDKSRPGVDLANEAEFKPLNALKIKVGVFVPEMRQGDIRDLKTAIVRHFKLSPKKTNNSGILGHGFLNANTLDQILGLAYTSTGCYAALWICNTEVYFDIEQKYRYEGFTIDMGGNTIAVLSNIQNDDTIYINI